MKFLEAKGFDIHIKNNNGFDAYLLAAWCGQLEVLKVLEKNGLNIHVTDDNNCDAYLYALSKGHLKIMEFLEEEKEFDIHIKTNGGNNAYLTAAWTGQIQIMEVLEAKGFNIHIKNSFGENAYILAALNGHLETMKFLEMKEIDIHIKTNYGHNAYTITRSLDIKTHLITLGFLPNGKIDIEYLYEQKMNKFIKICEDADLGKEDIDYECPICKSNIILNDRFIKCEFKHMTHDTCYKTYCESKNEISCDCILCFTTFIL
jgi:ankyrin repeat protein